MQPKFKVSLVNYKSITELPDAWSIEDYKILLRILDVGDISEIPDTEIKELCLMALTDLMPEDAANGVLTYLLDDVLTEGQIDNLAHEMVEEPMWEEFADMNCHEAIYNANQLLYTAYNGKFPKPTAVCLTIEVAAIQPEGKPFLVEPTEAFILRLLAGGMNEHSPLIRLFEEQITHGVLPEAAGIIWKIFTKKATGNVLTFEIIGSSYWLEDFKGTIDYSTIAFPDVVVGVG